MIRICEHAPKTLSPWLPNSFMAFCPCVHCGVVLELIEGALIKITSKGIESYQRKKVMQENFSINHTKPYPKRDSVETHFTQGQEPPSR